MPINKKSQHRKTTFRLPPAISFPLLEEEIIKFWKDNRIFEKSIESRPENKAYTFYDGPPFITGSPHHGSLLPSIAKDVIPRYWTMKGFRVRRVWGWDCHGLPTENKVEEKLGLRSKKDIEKIGVKKYVDECYAYVQNVSQEWEWYIDHIGRWVDFKNAYKTMDLPYMESVIWAFSRLYKKGLIYKGRRTSLFCSHCSTPLSNFEIAMDNSYRDVEDTAIAIKFRIKGQKKYILAWTTTPWTLPGNLALAVNKNEIYVEAENNREIFILAKPRLESTFVDRKYKIIREFSGQELLGLSYEPLYPFFPAGKNDYKIYHGDLVSMDEGTGVVHIAPGFGEEDAELGKEAGLSIIDHVDDEGKIIDKVTPFASLFVKEADPKVIDNLHKRRLLFKQEKITHSYPFCYRCGTPLIYKSQTAWFLDIDRIRQGMIDTNEKINWVPRHIKHGRFLQGIKTAPHWCLSRSRFWASPIPVWECECGEKFVPESIAELEKASGQKITNLHKPDIDEVTVKCAKCGKTVKRVPEVLDCWFESGSMPYAERHYPFENKDRFAKEFPADYIVEYIAQTRGWFYTLHVLSNALFGSEAFKNVIVTGVIMGTDGRKMSKLFRNYPDPKMILLKYGGEALRLYLMGSAVMLGNNMNISEKDIDDQVKTVLLPLWNCCKYLATYADLHDWQPEKESLPESNHVLDLWLKARTGQFTAEFEKALQKYRLPDAVRLVQPFIEDMSQWFIRQSRERFVNGDRAALTSLFASLKQFFLSVAPLMPFVSEYFWLHFITPYEKSAGESIHLESYPVPESFDQQLLDQMKNVRQICELGNAERKRVGIKNRQPLQKFEIRNSKFEIKEGLVQIVKNELNVGEIEITSGEGETEVKLDIDITPELRAAGEAADLIREIQVLRQKQGLALTDKIEVTAPNWPKNWEKEILRKTGATEITKAGKLEIKKI